jgi:hypothetical protein
MVVKVDEDELIEHWTLVGDELGQVAGKRGGDPLGLRAVANAAPAGEHHGDDADLNVQDLPLHDEPFLLAGEPDPCLP